MSQVEIERESAQLFRRLDDQLKANVDEPLFQEPKHFRSIVEILNVIDAKAQSSGGSSNLSILSSLKEQNPAYSILLEQRNVVNGVIEEVVKFEHGGLNYTMETMTEVVKEYNRGREDVRGLRKSLVETTGVLTSKKSGQISMKDLWLKKVEAEESLRIIKDLEFLKETPLRLQRLMQQRRYLSAVVSLNKATVIMFGEDLVAVQGLALVRETLMEIKGTILENVVLELQAAVLGLTDDQDEEAGGGNDESDDEGEDVLGDATRRRRAMAEQYGGTMGPVDLKELNETVEAGLANPTSKANSTLFIRLLVRAVGALSCEEDVERMLLENTSHQFQAVLKRVREAAVMRKVRKIKAGVDEKDGNEAMFVHYIGTLLQASIVVLQRLLYVLRLLHSMHKLRLSEPMGKYEMKEYNRTTVLLMWDDIELTINKELRVHLQDRAEVTDKSAAGAPLTGAIGAAGVMGDDADDADYQPDETTSIFIPSSSLAAPIFKKVLDFSEHLDEIMVAEGVHDPKGGSGGIGGGGGEVKTNKPVSIMEALVASGKVDEKFPSLVLESLQKFLEEELMPLVQLQVNNDLREIQINPTHYSLPATASSSTSTEAASRALGQTVPLSYAALSCASTALPLYNYWLQLPQHNDMVLTILERLVRGFMQAAKEEMDAHTWKLMSYEDKYRSKVAAAMRRDPVFAAYKATAYGGCASIDELLRDYASSSGFAGGSFTASGGGGASEIAPPGAGSSGGGGKAYNNNAEMDSWGSLWELSLVQYPTMGDKGTGHEDRILKDASSVSTVSCIVHGCDWLVQQLERACAACVKRHTQEMLARSARETGAPPPPTSPYQDHQQSKRAMDLLSKYGVQDAQQKGKKETLLDEQEPLKTAVFGLCKDLARLADDGLAVLRAEWQIATFHFLHKLCQVRFSPGKAKDEASASAASGGLEAENVIALLSQHLFFFQESALQTIHPSAVAVLLSPLTQLIPRILMRVVQVQCSNGNIANDTDRSKPLRMIVACQQSLSNLVEGSKPEAAPLKVLMGRMAEEFEHVRRYVTLLDMSPKELSSWMRSNWLAYAEFEYQTLWKQAVARALLDPQNANVRFASFDETWKEIAQKNKATARQEGRR